MTSRLSKGLGIATLGMSDLALKSTKKATEKAVEAITPEMPKLPKPQKAPGLPEGPAEVDPRQRQARELEKKSRRRGRALTILTGPLGATSQAQTTGKTLLGK